MHVPFRDRIPVLRGLLVLAGASALFASAPFAAPLEAGPAWSPSLMAPDTTTSPPAAGPPPGRVRLDLTPQSPATALTGVPIPGGLPEEPRIETRTENGQHHATFWGRYNRVEGMALHLSLVRRLTFKDFVPAYRGEIGFAFAADRGQYHLGLEQPVAPRSKITLGAEGYRNFLPFFYQEEALSSEENTASALLLHKDYWDWYEAEGLRGFVGLYPSPFFNLQLGILQQDEASLENNTDWSLFNQRDDFVTNPSIVEGEYRAFQVKMSYDSRPKDWQKDIRPRSSWGGVEYWYRAGWERADGGLGGDFDLWRVDADFRNYFRVSTRQTIATRIFAGTGENNGAPLPPQRRFALGGLGTLRGHNYRSEEGNHAVLANIEYSFSMGNRERATALFFIDSGAAWDVGSLFDQFIPVDVGAGLRLGDITMLVATAVNRSDTGAKFFVRFQESF